MAAFTEDDAQDVLATPAATVVETPAPAAKPFTEQDAEGVLNAAPRTANAPGQPMNVGFAGPMQSVFTGINKEIANALGAPVTLVHEFTKRFRGLTGEPQNAEPLGGQGMVQRLFSRLGLTPPGNAPMAERVGETIGQSATSLIPMLGAGSKVPGVAGRVMQQARVQAAQKPARFMASELGSATTAGVGGAIAEEAFPGNPAAEMSGEIVGGLTPGLLAFSPQRLILKAIRRTVIPFTASGARDRAAQRLNELVPDPEAAANRLETPSDLGLSPAQRTGEPELLSLEQNVLESNVRLGRKFEENAALSNRLIRQKLDDVADPGDISNTREFLEGRRQYLDSLLDARKANAVALAQQRIEKVIPRLDRQQANTILREELDKALVAARRQEQELWGAVPKDQTVAPTLTQEAMQDILARRNVASDPEDIPGFVRELVGGLDDQGAFKPGTLGNASNIGTLNTLRSRILQEGRAERAKAAPNRQKLDVLDDLQDAILEDMGVATSQNGREAISEAGSSVLAALDFSRSLNDRFRRGPVGSLLGFERRGGPAVAPGMTLERTVGKGGPAGAEGLDAVLRASDTPEGRGVVEEFMKNLFVLQATNRDGRVTPAAAERFMARHQQVLDRFPDLRNQLADANTAQQMATDTAAHMDARAASLRDKKTSRAALFLGAPPDREIETVLRSGDPKGAMSELVKMAGKDPDKFALPGLKAGYVQNLLDRVETSSFDINGQPFFSGRRMRRLLADEDRAIAPLFTQPERQELDRLARAAMDLEAAMKARPLERIIDDQPSMLIALMARTIGARAGAQLGASTSGSALLTASAGSRFVRRIAEKLTADRAKQLLADSTQDPNLLRALLTDASTPKRREFVQKKLNAWMATVGERGFDNEQPQSE